MESKKREPCVFLVCYTNTKNREEKKTSRSRAISMDYLPPRKNTNKQHFDLVNGNYSVCGDYSRTKTHCRDVINLENRLINNFAFVTTTTEHT